MKAFGQEREVPMAHTRPPAGPPTPDAQAIQRAIVEILDGNQLMSLATNRSDGWPQATAVNYLRDGRALYFLVARDSQKFENISRDPRVAISIFDVANSTPAVRALSMSARITEVVGAHRIGEINALIQNRSSERRFTPHPSNPSVAVLEARPELVSVVDYSTPPGRQDLVRIVDEWRVERAAP